MVGSAAAQAAPLPLSAPGRPARAPSHRRSRPGAPAGGVALRAIGVYESVFTSAFLDRLVRGRLWIGMLASALVGVVALQLVVLNLNTDIGRRLARVALLQRENAQLGIEDAGALGEARIEPLAAATGMTFAPSGSAHFVVASPSDVSRAAASLGTPVQAQTRSSASLAAAEAASGSAAPSGAEAPAAGGETQAGTGSPSTSEAPGASSGETSTGTGTGAAGVSGGESSAGASSAAQGGASAASASGEAAGGTGVSVPSESSTASSSAGTGGGVAAGHG